MSLMDSFSQLEPKQKVTLAVTVLLMIFVAYLGYDTFFPEGINSSKEQTTSPAVVQTSLPPPPTTQASGDSTTPGNLNGVPSATVPDMSSIIEQKSSELTPEQLALLAESQELQRQYLKMVNEYQLYQMQQKVETAKGLLAAAELKNQQIQAQKDAFEQKEKVKVETQNLQPENEVATSLKVVFVGRRSGEWVAVFKGPDDAYIQVKEGTRLADGTVVDAINDKGVVVISKNGKKSFIAMPKSID